MEAHQANMEGFEASKTVFEVRKKAIEDRINKAAKAKNDKAESLQSIVGELSEHQRGAPCAPILRRYKTNDSTIEKLGELLRENTFGLLVSWEREGREGERAFLLEGWNGNASFDTDRIGRGSIFVPNLCLSIFGGIQPDKLTGYLEQAANALANDGMLQRFQLLVYPDHRAWSGATGCQTSKPGTASSPYSKHWPGSTRQRGAHRLLMTSPSSHIFPSARRRRKSLSNGLLTCTK